MIPKDVAASPREFRGAPSTPIADAIRHRLRSCVDVDTPLVAHVAANAGNARSGGAAGFSLFFQDTSNLPHFQENELDDPQLLSSAAAEIYRMRRARDRHMPNSLMGEPAWDILLALYAEEPAKLPVSSVCYAAAVPQTTALRWISVLENEGFLERTHHARDGRLILLSLTEQGRVIVERSLKAMLRASHG